ncbi:MAG: HAD family hydrolase [Methylobacter sp.]
MIELNIPGFCDFQLAHAVFDYNGTIAIDGLLIPGVKEAIATLGRKLHVHVMTTDMTDLARSQLAGLPIKLVIVPPETQAESKLDFITRLGPHTVIAIGNGRNDAQMLRAAAIGIALIQKEGAAQEAVFNADIVSTNILDALELINNQDRLIRTLCS